MSSPKNRPLDPESKPDDRVDNALRPQKLADLIGQDQVKQNLSILIDAAKRWIMCCFTDLPASARPRWRMCWVTRWVSTSKSQRDPPSSVPVTWPPARLINSLNMTGS